MTAMVTSLANAMAQPLRMNITGREPRMAGSLALHRPIFRAGRAVSNMSVSALLMVFVLAVRQRPAMVAAMTIEPVVGGLKTDMSEVAE